MLTAKVSWTRRISNRRYVTAKSVWRVWRAEQKRRDVKDCHVGIGDGHDARGFSGPPGGRLKKVPGVRAKPLMHESSLSLRGHVSPYWYMRGVPQTALSGAGDPTERQAFLEALAGEPASRHGVKGVVGSCVARG